jgi:hypothetical protein
MTNTEPASELNPRFSSQGATPTPWAEAHEHLQKAEIYWLSTVRADGHPHVTPLVAVWLDGALYFCTGPDERKAQNLARNAHCVIITGCNALSGGLDLVVEGDTVKVSDEARLRRVAMNMRRSTIDPLTLPCATAPFTATPAIGPSYTKLSQQRPSASEGANPSARPAGVSSLV